MVTHLKKDADRNISWKSFQQQKLSNICGCIGAACSGFAEVLHAKDASNDSVAVRACPLDQEKMDFQALQKEVVCLRQLKHPNIIQCKFSYIFGNLLYIGFPLMDFGSVTDVVQARFTCGLSELAIAMILSDIAKALTYIHSRDLVHRSIRCSHILLSSEGSGRACLSGFRYCTSLMQKGRRLQTLHEFPLDSKPNLFWFAPELLQQNLLGYGPKSDIYSLGITICEMANGFPPFADMEPMQMMLEKLKGTTPRLLDKESLVPNKSEFASPADLLEAENSVPLEQRTRSFSPAFHQFTELCLKSDPSTRPSAADLMSHGFFKQLKKNKRSLIDLLRPLSPLKFSPPVSPPAQNKTSVAGTSYDSDHHYSAVEWFF